MTTTGHDDETLHAIGELLKAAEQAGLGVCFEPEDNGWKVSYVMLKEWPAYENYELKGGALSNAYSLDVAAKAALKPLVELGDRCAEYFARREADF